MQTKLENKTLSNILSDSNLNIFQELSQTIKIKLKNSQPYFKKFSYFSHTLFNNKVLKQIKQA